MSAGRREFLGACGRCAAAVVGLTTPLLTACASLVVRRVPVVDGRVELLVAQHPELMEPGGALKVLPDGFADPIILLRQEDGSVTALSSVCTHLGCSVDVASERLVCPCHGSTFDRRGAVLRGPAEAPLTRYRVGTSAEGIITIQLRGTA